MEIHPPHGPLRSVKEILLQLFVITLGIVIALSFEGVREWHRERTLIREARENMLREIRDNKRDLDEMLKKAPEYDNQRKRVLELIASIQQHKPAKGTYSYGIFGGLMGGAAWNAAQATGALALMDYSEASRFANVYEFQQRYNNMTERLFAQFAVGRAMFMQDPDKFSAREMETYKQAVLTDWAYLGIYEKLSEDLSKEYAKVLKAEK